MKLNDGLKYTPFLCSHTVYLQDDDPDAYDRLVAQYMDYGRSQGEAEAEASRVTVSHDHEEPVAPTSSGGNMDGDIYDSYYGGDAPSGDPAIFGGLLSVISLSALLPLLPESWRMGMLAWLGGMGLSQGTRIAMSSVLTWMRGKGAIVGALAALLGTIAADAVLEIDIPIIPPNDGDGGGSLPAPYQGGAPLPVPSGGEVLEATLGPGLFVVNSWVSGYAKNGTEIRHWLLSNGARYSRRANGTIRGPWRPRKTIVLTSSGAKDLRTLAKAANALDKQTKGLRKVLNKIDPPARKPRQTSPQTIVVHESGSGSVHTR